MNRSVRYLVLALALASFASLTSGLTLCLHVAAAGEPDHHDSTHCSLCSMLLLGIAKFQLEAPAPVSSPLDLIATVCTAGTVVQHQHVPRVLAPRPPPAPAV